MSLGLKVRISDLHMCIRLGFRRFLVLRARIFATRPISRFPGMDEVGQTNPGPLESAVPPESEPKATMIVEIR